MIWYRVDADYGAGWVLVGEVNEHASYLALAYKAFADGAVHVRVYKCTTEEV